MKAVKVLWIFLFLFPMLVFSQQAKLLKGNVASEGFGVPGITIMNLVTEKVIQSNPDGSFEIVASADDLLVFSSQNYEYKRKIIEPEDIAKGEIKIQIVRKAMELQEVVINYDLNPEDMGLVPKGQKTYTPAQRRLKTAGELKPTALIGMVAGLSIPVDPIINAITGRTKMLKKEVEIEQREFNLEKLAVLFDDSFYIKKLKVPADNIKGFHYYLIGNPDFVAVLTSGNKQRIKFKMTELAETFLKLTQMEHE